MTLCYDLLPVHTKEFYEAALETPNLNIPCILGVNVTMGLAGTDTTVRI